jgi:uncharacterized BrkB/YihY/UPF0761 family membrane protein
LLPLLLVLFSVLGFVLDGHPGLRHRVVGSVLREFPVIGPALRENVGAVHGSGVALGLGIAGSLYGALGVMQAAQAVFNHVYAVPRNAQPNPLRSRVRSLALLAVLGAGLLLATALTWLAATTNELTTNLGPGLHAAVYLLGFVAGSGLFSLALQLLTSCELRLRDVATGGVLTAAFWQGLQILGGPWIAHRLTTAGQVYGQFALVLVAIGWIYLQALAFVLAAELNVVLQQKLWPRSLLTPFTDRVELTEADRRVYAMYAQAQQFKGCETVTTHFDEPDTTPRGD